MFKTLQDVIANMPERGQKPVVKAYTEDGAQILTYTELHTQATALARGLRAMGLKTGEAVGMMLPTCPESFIISLGIIEGGGAVLPMDAQLSPSGLSHILADSEARFVFTTSELTPKLVEAGLPEAGCLQLDAQEESQQSWRQVLERGNADGAAEAPRIGPEDWAALFYTSGTTGRPKGVPLTHANIVFQQNALVEAKLVGPQDTMLLPLPLHHVYPFVIGIFTSLSLGLSVVLPQSITGPHILGAVKEGGVTVIAGVPRLYAAMLTGIRNKAAAKGFVPRLAFEGLSNLSATIKDKTGLRVGKKLLGSLHKTVGPTLQVLASGGSPLDPTVARGMEALGWKIAVGYGLTETSPILTVDAPGEARAGTVGKPLPGVSIRIQPMPGLESLPEGVGEVQATGPNVFGGYRNLPEKNKEAFTEDGWFRTGDLGCIEEDGRLTLHGRASAMIVTDGGENVDPEKVEQALEAHPVIAEAAVLAWKGGVATLIVPEAVEARSRRSNIEEVVREAVTQIAQDLPSYQRPLDVAVSKIPLERTRLGKLRRHKLVDQFERAKAGLAMEEAPAGPVPVEEWPAADRTLLDHPKALAVWNWLCKRYPETRLSPSTQLQLDLGVDSLEWLAIGLELKSAAGVEISEQAASTIVTVRDLLQEACCVVHDGPHQAPPPVSIVLQRPEDYLSEEESKWLASLSPFMRLCSKLFHATFGWIVRRLFQVEIRGVEKLHGLRQFVFAPNHLSYLDPFLILPMLPYAVLEKMYVAGWTGAAFHNAFNRFFSRLAKTVPIDPDRGVAASLALGAAVLKRGKSLLWFPEGVRSTSGRLREFRPGLGMLLEHYPVTVVPVMIHGSWEALPPGALRIKRTKVTIVVGDPVTPLELLAEAGEEGTQPVRLMRGTKARVAAMQAPFMDVERAGASGIAPGIAVGSTSASGTEKDSGNVS